MKDIALIFAMAGFAGWALVERAFHLGGFSQQRTSRKENKSFLLLSFFWYGAILVSFADALYTSWTATWIGLHWGRWLGVALILIGIGLRYLARRQLGKHYSVHVQTSGEHALITSGIYRHVRHPAYLGLLCLLIGIPSAAWSIPGMVLAIAGGVPSLVYRIPIEEAALLDWFGDAYAEYSERTWRMIPWIW